MANFDEQDDLLLNDATSKTWRLSQVEFIKKHRWIPCCCCGFLGFILAALSAQLIFLPTLIDEILKTGIRDSMIFRYVQPDSSSYQTWLSNAGKNGVPIWMEMRFFNITNSDDMLRYGDNPHLVLSNPIVYNEYEVKQNVSFSDDGQWANYNTWTYYTFNQDKSKISKSDYFIIFSPFVTFLYNEHENGDLIDKLVLDEIFQWLDEHPELLFFQGTAEGLLFDLIEIDIPIKRFNYTYHWEFGGLLGNSTENGSNPGSVLHTGYGDESRIGEMKSWKGSEFVNCWNPSLALSPGHDDYFGIFTIKKDEPLLAWVDNLFVNLVVDYNGTQMYHGIELYRYTVQITPQLLNVTEWPPNALYWAYGSSGILNLTNCASGIPFFVSLPLFLGGADYEANNSKMGLSNLDWSMQPYLSVEPKTGVIFDANKSLQLNTQLRPIPESWLKGEESSRRLIDGDDIVTVEVTDDEFGTATDTPTTATPTTATPTTATPTTATPTTVKPTTATPTTAKPTTATPTTATPTTATPTTATPTTAVPTTETPTTATPTSKPTTAAPTAPTVPPRSLSNVPWLTVPIMETSECEGLSVSQAKDFTDLVDGAENMISALKIVGYIAIPLLVLYTWWVCFWCGKRRARIRK